ncbi:base plate tail tube protein [Vibrio phage phi 3]|uniref:Minor tail protein n=1 Tax=Vibrio phage phi 3 TaxID=1589298 RepID=A0A0B5HEC6_9CAUD|nr:base plate tail tube protein [Vibrio phage phi 3]AJF40900.1 minor tail protein [Vibrio phage phi 3]
MTYTLKRECEILVVYKGVGYLFDALPSFDFSQTFSKTSNPRRTLHNNSAKPVTISGAKNTANFSMEVLITDSYIESVFFEIAGWNKLGNNVYEYPDSVPIIEPCTIYILNPNKNVAVRTAFIESIDLPMAKASPKSLSVSFTASSIDEGVKVEGVGMTHRQATPLPPSPIQISINSTLANHVTSASFNTKNSVSWRQDRGIHDVGKVYTPSRAVVSDMSMTGTINLYATKSLVIPSNKPIIVDLHTHHSGVTIKMDSVHLLKRLEPDDVFVEALDITLMEMSKNVIVDFGGITI